MGANGTSVLAAAGAVLSIGVIAPGLLRASDRETSGVVALYEDWRAHHEQAGAGTRLEIPLGWAKGLSVDGRQAGGMARLDSAAGALVVEAWGLAGEADVWLVENRPGLGASALADSGDGVRRVGSLSPVGGAARLAVDLAAAGLDGALPDRVLVCRAGQGPREGMLLMGSPSAFQRLYARERRGLLPGDGVPEPVIEDLVARGQQLFEEETFAGNGRTCASCHPATNNFTIDPRFIAGLPEDDPLFVAEFVPALGELENPLLMRSRGLILENVDGFDRPGVMRGVPHTLALPTSLRGPEIPFDNTFNPAFGILPPAERTGWGGDGAPGSGSLREFAIGAVMQHFPRTLARRDGEDFRLPTDDELDALELFQLSLGRSEDLDLSRMAFTSPLVAQGVVLFNRLDTQNGTVGAGKCSLCHNQAGANIDPVFFGNVLGAPVSGNANFGTGVNELLARPEDLIDPGGAPQDGGFARVFHDGVNCQPPRGGFGTVTPEGGALPPGLCEEDFNTPPLVEAADTGPFFHDHAVDTLEAAVAFYDDEAFNQSAGGQLLAALDSGGIGIRLDASEVSAIASFLRVVNALENIRESTRLARDARSAHSGSARELLERAVAEERDAVEVLEGVGLGLDAVEELRRAIHDTRHARRAWFRHFRKRHLDRALEHLTAARGLLVEEGGAS